MQALGARIDVDHYDFTMQADGLRGADIFLDEASVTGTENAVMAAVLAKGTTVIRNAASEPHVQDLCRLLNGWGAQIEGIGTNMLTIQGVDRLRGGEFTISPDHIEVGSFIGLGAVTPRRDPHPRRGARAPAHDHLVLPSGWACGCASTATS